MAQAIVPETIFEQAIGIGDDRERAAFLDRACGVGNALRAGAERLVSAHLQAGEFLARPAISVEVVGEDEGPVAGSQIGPYRLVEQIGEAGMGLVYMAEQQRPVKRLVALKIIKPGMDSKQVIARFEAERQALAMMDHPNIARILDAGTVGAIQNSERRMQKENASSPVLNSEFCILNSSSRPYFVMELVRGVPITEFCEQRQLPLEERLRLVIDVCRAVQHAHQKGVIHRDLKPTNVLVTLDDTAPVPKIIDFGIAKALGQSLTDHTLHTGFGQFIGTLLYMSPEQAELNLRGVDTRSDVYSLGVLLYELITGTTPFEKDRLEKLSFDEKRRVIREEEPETVSTRIARTRKTGTSGQASRDKQNAKNPSSFIPHPSRRSFRLHPFQELNWIVAKCLEKDRERRYESASGLAADLQRYLNNEPVQACPPSTLYRVQKFYRRNQKSLFTATIVSTLVWATAVTCISAYSQRVKRLQETSRVVEALMAAATTAFNADDLTLAHQRAAEAKGRLGSDAVLFQATATAINELAAEIDCRLQDQRRFERFSALIREANYELDPHEKESEPTFREALELYEVIDDQQWIDRVNRSTLNPVQRQLISEESYRALILLAYFGVYRDVAPRRLSQSIQLLDRAITFHEPTRALWFIRRDANRGLGNEETAKEDHQRYKDANGKNPWDHWIPGHVAGWGGNSEYALAQYRQALRLDPTHVSSLYFLGHRLELREKYDEAIAYYTACIVARPNYVWTYDRRAKLFVLQGKMEEAEADYAAALANANHDYLVIAAHYDRYKFFMDLNRRDEAVRELTQGMNASLQALDQRLSKLNYNPRSTLKVARWTRMFPQMLLKLAKSESSAIPLVTTNIAESPQAATSSSQGDVENWATAARIELLLREAINRYHELTTHVPDDAAYMYQLIALKKLYAQHFGGWSPGESDTNANQ